MAGHARRGAQILPEDTLSQDWMEAQSISEFGMLSH